MRKHDEARETKPKPITSADSLVKGSKKATATLSEEELKEVSGGCCTGKHYG